MSAANVKSADPSMEEILASIRRIIADEEEVKSAEEMAAAAAAAEAKRIADEAAAAAAAAAEDDGVLDLAEMPDVSRAGSNSLDLEVPDLSFHSSDDFSEPGFAEIHVPEPEPEPVAAVAPEPSRPAAPEPVAALAPAPVEPAAPPAMEPRAQAAPRAAPSAAESLISQEATTSVGHAFNLLSHTIMSQNAHTLEDLVREMLKPMLKTWLDDNLPPLVERLVSQEIERVARGRR